MFVVFGGRETPAHSIGCGANIAQALAKEYGQSGVDRAPADLNPLASRRPLASSAASQPIADRPSRSPTSPTSQRPAALRAGANGLHPLKEGARGMRRKDAHEECASLGRSTVDRRDAQSGVAAGASERRALPHNLLIYLSRRCDGLRPPTPLARPFVGTPGNGGASDS